MMASLMKMDEMFRFAQAMAECGVFGTRDPNMVLAAMALAQSQGLHIMAALDRYYIMQTKQGLRPVMKTDAMLADFQASGGRVEWLEYSPTKVTGNFTHPFHPKPLVISMTIQEARNAGLARGHPDSAWTKFPLVMLTKRVSAMAIRMIAPGCVPTVVEGEIDYGSTAVMDVAPVQQSSAQTERQNDDSPERFIALLESSTTIAEATDFYRAAHRKYRDSPEIMSGITAVKEKIKAKLMPKEEVQPEPQKQIQQPETATAEYKEY